MSLDPWRCWYLINVCAILGGAYDTVPEVCILLALFEKSDHFYPVVFDESGKKFTLDDGDRWLMSFFQAIVSRLNTSYLLSKVLSQPNNFSTIGKPSQSFLVIPS